MGGVSMEWKEVTLGDLCEISSSKRIFAKEYQSDGVPFYRGKEIIAKQKGNAISNELFISRNRYEEIKARYGVPQQRELLLTSVGTLGVPYVIKEEEFYFKDGNLTWFRHFNGLDVEYLYYWFLSPYGKNEINTKAIGSTQKALTIDSLSKFDIKIPVNLDDQRRIASILSSLDRKIELNNKINADLEEMAQAIFKNWFVDFEPFKDGKFVDSELGMIPEGWKVGTLGDITKNKSAKVKEKNDVKVLSPVTTGELVLSEEYFTKQVFSSSIAKYKIVNKGDFAYNPARVNIGSLGRNEFDFDGCVSPVYVVFSVLEGYENYFDLFRKTDFFKDSVASLAIGGVRQSLSYDDLSLIETIIPSENIVEKFNNLYNQMKKTIKANKQENSRLSLLRDTLLPRLMSGELEVPE